MNTTCAAASTKERTLRQAVEQVSDQLCLGVSGKFDFTVKVEGTLSGDVIKGRMKRVDKPHLELPIRLLRRSELP